jgi:aspartate aminotransferase
VSYPDQVRLAGGVPVGIPTTEADGWLLSPEALDKAITPRTKALVLNSPCNPTGAVYDGDALRALVNLAVMRNLLVISDEIYRDLLYDGVPFASALSAVNGDGRSRIFTVDGVSKSYAMTGWRIGWGIGDPDIIRGMIVMQGQTISCPTAVSQDAAREALSRDADFLPAWRSEYAARRDAMVRGLNAMAGVTCRCPCGAFYVFPDVTGLAARLGAGKTDEDVARWLLDEARVATVPGSAFGAPGYLRLSYAVAMSLVTDGLDRMAAAISAL